MQIIQKKGNVKKKIVINIYEKVSLCEYEIYVILPLQVKLEH